MTQEPYNRKNRMDSKMILTDEDLEKEIDEIDTLLNEADKELQDLDEFLDKFDEINEEEHEDKFWEVLNEFNETSVTAEEIREAEEVERSLLRDLEGRR